MESQNLNKLITLDQSAQRVRDREGITTVYFRNIVDHLAAHIHKAGVVVGCIAWLTNKRILETLSKVPNGVSIIVQKEDFLRPDIGGGDNWREYLRGLYDKLPSLQVWPDLLNIVTDALIEDNYIYPVRCFGKYNKGKMPASPRMHHKFLVFCNQQKITNDSHDESVFIKPYAVWTGSFNITKNASFSLENAIYIDDARIAQAYYNEWQEIAFISEPLDWESDWIQPEWSVT